MFGWNCWRAREYTQRPPRFIALHPVYRVLYILRFILYILPCVQTTTRLRWRFGQEQQVYLIREWMEMPVGYWIKRGALCIVDFRLPKAVWTLRLWGSRSNREKTIEENDPHYLHIRVVMIWWLFDNRIGNSHTILAPKNKREKLYYIYGERDVYLSLPVHRRHYIRGSGQTTLLRRGVIIWPMMRVRSPRGFTEKERDDIESNTWKNGALCW